MAVRDPQDTAWYDRDPLDDTVEDKVRRAEAVQAAAEVLEDDLQGEHADKIIDRAVDVLRDWATYVEYNHNDSATAMLLDALAEEVENREGSYGTIERLRDRANQLHEHADANR